MFDEQPDGDMHGECAAEIHRLEAENQQLRDQLAASERKTEYWRDLAIGAKDQLTASKKDTERLNWMLPQFVVTRAEIDAAIAAQKEKA